MIRFYGCSHATDLVYPEPLLLEKLDFCHSCDSKNINRWLCLSVKCGYVGCGQKANDHSLKHFQKFQHPIAINLYNHKAFCNVCQFQVFRECSEKNMMNGYTKSPYENHIYDNDMDSTYDDRPIGLVGLKNLGNTCYMNAALQCLLNVPQLTEYFESMHPSFFENKAFTLARQYQSLVVEVFDFKKKSYIVPSGVSHTMKAVYPPFRGYMQQDTQEFLRVFMDKLHNETKYSYISPVNNNNKMSTVNTSLNDCNSSNNYQISRSQKPQHIKVHRSIISDVFQGKLSNSIKCLQCTRISCNIDYFEDLSLPIASEKIQLHPKSSISNTKNWWSSKSKSSSSTNESQPIKKHQSQNSSNISLKASSNALALIYYQLRWFISFLLWIKNWFTGRSVTLEQCLELFFSQDELKGDNKYSCDKCKGHQNAVMQSKLLYTPEILCLHLKRFKNDFGCSKITTAVKFPVDGLDMRPYLHPNHTNLVWMYDLIGVICHCGSVGSAGHYTAYVLNWRSQCWFELDDDHVSEVDVNTVLSLTSSAYVLFYKKRDDRMLTVRENADKLLKTTANESMFKYYLSRQWVVRFNTFAEPGPITNWEFLCPHGVIQPDKMNNIHELTIEITQKTWDYLFERFGGGPICTSLVTCSTCAKKRSQLQERRQRESSTFGKLHQIFEGTVMKQDVHVLSLRWFRKWEDFIKGIDDEPPGPIDNSDILLPVNSSGDNEVDDKTSDITQCQFRININTDYGYISMKTWLFLYGIYGGGPAHNISPSQDLVQDDDSVVSASEKNTNTLLQNNDDNEDSESCNVKQRLLNTKSTQQKECNTDGDCNLNE